MISYNKLISLMEKGDAPSKIIFNGKEFLYTMKDIPKKERLQDIEKYGIWNNGGYYTEENDFLVEEIGYVHNGEIDHEIKDIYILPENKKIDDNKKDNNWNELKDYISRFLYMLNGILDRDVYEQCQLDDFTQIMDKIKELEEK